MNRVHWTIALSAFIGIALAAGPAAAVIIINPVDGFGDPQYQSASGPNGDTNVGDAGRTVAVTAGLVSPSGRSIFVEKTTGSANVNLRVESLDDDTDGTFNVSRASGIGGRVLVQWDGGTLDTDAPGAFDPLNNLTHLLGAGAGINLTAGGADGLAVRVLNADLATQQLTITLFGPDNTVASEQSVVLPSVVPPGAYDALFPLAGFTLRSGASSIPNPNAIYAITLAITGPSGADLTLDLLGTYAAPEPATVSLFGLGGVALLARSRRRWNHRAAVGDGKLPHIA
jgi:hypothetical protein